jgi:predicted nucleic acid-binding protein
VTDYYLDASALSRFLQDCTGFLILPVDRLVIDRAVDLTQNYRLRGYDAIQLAAALVTSDLLESQTLSPLTFVAGDQDLLAAAQAENLPAADPLAHS